MGTFIRDLIHNHIRKNRYAGERSGRHMDDHKPGKQQPQLAASVHGYHALYLGKVPTHCSNSQEQTTLCVEKLLDICNMNETFIDEVFLDIKSFALIMHYVDITSKVIDTRLFDLARISYCSAGNFEDPRILAWVYRQETEQGFQLECHAVRCKTIRKTKIIVYQLYDAITKLFVEVQAALQASTSYQSAKQADDDTHTGAKRRETVGKTVRFDDCVQRIDFEIDESSSLGDDSVFYEEGAESDKVSEKMCRLQVCEDEEGHEGNSTVMGGEDGGSGEAAGGEARDGVAELSCPCTPLLTHTPAATKVRTVVEVDNPCFEDDTSEREDDNDSSSDNTITYCEYMRTSLDELEDSASSGFGEDDQDGTDLNCFQDIAL